MARVSLPEAIDIKGEDGKLRRLTEPASVDVPVGTNLKLLGGKPRPTLFREIFNAMQYAPADSVQQPYPVRDLEWRVA